MRRFSKIAAVAMVGALALAGCGSNGSGGSGDKSSASNDVCKSAKGSGPKVGVAYDVGGRGDQSFNDSAYKGLTKAVDDLDATCIEAKATTADNDTTRAERLRTLAEGGYNPVIAIGYLYSPAAAKVAAENPDTSFAVVDGYSTTIPKSPLKNLNDLVFQANEGSYLVGVAAALKTKAKHVGFIGGVPGAVIGPFEAGYRAGVASVDPAIKVDVQYLTQDQGDAQAAYENPPGAQGRGLGDVRERCRRRLPRRRQVRVWVCSRPPSPPATASGPSVSTPTSTSRPRRTSRRTSSPRRSSAWTPRSTTRSSPSRTSR